MGILDPQFLTSRIPLVATILGGITLVMFSDVVGKRIVFPIADIIKGTTFSRLSSASSAKGNQRISGFISDSLATIIFILFIYFGSYVLAEFVYGPILLRLKDVTTIIFLGLFMGISFIINNKRARRRFFKV